MNQQVEYSLLEPLMGSDAEGQEIAFKSRKEVLANRVDTWGRARLFLLSIFAFLIIYVSIASSRITLEPIPVKIPPDDNKDPSFSLSPATHKNPTDVLEHANYTTVLPSLLGGKLNEFTNDSEHLPIVPKGYLVWSPQCKIVSLNHLAADVMQLYHREKPLVCSTKPILTEVRWSPQNNRYIVEVAKATKKSFFGSGPEYCTIQEVHRKSEDEISFTKAIKFKDQFELSQETDTIYVECFKTGNSKAIYKDVHLVVQRKQAVLDRISAHKALENDTTFPSVLMLGIDSISRLNLLRAMPATAQHLYDTGWFEMKGYNKMGDNTYPNLMAILTGYNLTWAYDKCRPTIDRGLDECPFIWKEFSDAGYVTGYAEDEPEIGTFNYRKKGFHAIPTDFYGRSGMLACMKKLPKVLRSNLAICLGERTAADYIYNYGLDITEKFQREGTFGLYWTNSFSHNDLNTPSSMDDKVKYFLEELHRRGILNNTIVVFFSDHGIRFGPIRKLVTGWMEERLPFLFFWLPEWFQEKHPEFVSALNANRNRLTNPYDLHLTLKHILRLSGRAKAVENNSEMGCINCQSMFYEVPWNRSCEEIGIDAHWCTCSPYLPINKDSAVVKHAVSFLLDDLNREIKTRLNGTTKANGGRLCAELHLKTIYFAGETKYSADTNDILIQVQTWPGGGEFESTLRYKKSRNEFTVTGTSRLNMYSKHSDCVSDGRLRMFCECI